MGSERGTDSHHTAKVKTHLTVNEKAEHVMSTTRQSYKVWFAPLQ